MKTTTLSHILLITGIVLVMIGTYMLVTAIDSRHISVPNYLSFIVGMGLILLSIAILPIYKDSKFTAYETLLDMLPEDTVYWSRHGYLKCHKYDEEFSAITWKPWIGKKIVTYYITDTTKACVLTYMFNIHKTEADKMVTVLNGGTK